MVLIFTEYWYLFALFFFFGVFLTVSLSEILKNKYKDFKSKAPIIRKYWTFVIPFSFTLCITYILIFKYASQSNISNYLSVFGQIAALIFAVFIGYFSFLQLVESRVTNLRLEGYDYFKRKSYRRAIEIYEQVVSIKPKDFYSFAELVELYLANKDFLNFDKKIILLEKNVLDPRDSLIIFYFKIARNLLVERLGDAREQIDSLIVFKRENPNLFFAWDFEDIKNAQTYIELSDGDAKRIFDNVIKYFIGMPDDEKTRFEKGDFSLSQPTVNTIQANN